MWGFTEKVACKLHIAIRIRILYVHAHKERTNRFHWKPYPAMKRPQKSPLVQTVKRKLQCKSLILKKLFITGRNNDKLTSFQIWAMGIFRWVLAAKCGAVDTRPEITCCFLQAISNIIRSLTHHCFAFCC